MFPLIFNNKLFWSITYKTLLHTRQCTSIIIYHHFWVNFFARRSPSLKISSAYVSPTMTIWSVIIFVRLFTLAIHVYLKFLIDNHCKTSWEKFKKQKNCEKMEKIPKILAKICNEFSCPTMVTSSRILLWPLFWVKIYVL